MLPPSVHQILRSQYGLIGRRQAREMLTRNEVRRLCRHPDIEPLSGRVLRHRSTPVSLGTQLLAPVLDAQPNAALWDESAALWWGFGRDRSPIVQVARVRHDIREPLGRLHRVTGLDQTDFTVHQGIPIARPERVILGLAAAWTRAWKPSRFRGGDLTDAQVLAPVIDRVGASLDHAWRQGLIDGPFIHDLADRFSVSGQAGIVALREALKRRPPDYLARGSRLEERFEQLLGAPAQEFDRQVEIRDTAGLIGRVDYWAKRVALVVEVNGETFHSSLTDRANDDRRYQRLLAVGLSVLVVWEYDIWHQPAAVREAVIHRLRLPDGEPKLHRPTRAPWELLPERTTGVPEAG